MNPATIPAALLAASFAVPILAQEGETKPPAQAATQDPAAKAPAVLEVGATVPTDLGLTDLDGKEFSFGDVRGKTVVIHFWSITCPWEKVAEPKLCKIAADYQDKDVVVVAINANAGEIGAQPDAAAFASEDESKKPYGKIRKHVEKTSLNHRVLIDHSGDVARRFAAQSTPHCFVVDAKGKLVYSGALDNDGKGTLGDKAQHYVRDAVDAVQAGKDVATSTTKPYG
jgi:thiol-disulfide isomerase/thioredoxin